jgi:hypothetical protein
MTVFNLLQNNDYKFYYKTDFTFLLLGSDISYAVDCDVNDKKKDLVKEYMG